MTRVRQLEAEVDRLTAELSLRPRRGDRAAVRALLERRLARLIDDHPDREIFNLLLQLTEN